MNNSNTNIDWNTLQNIDWNNTFTNLLPCELEIEKLKKKNLEILETQKKIENILEETQKDLNQLKKALG